MISPSAPLTVTPPDLFFLTLVACCKANRPFSFSLPLRAAFFQPLGSPNSWHISPLIGRWNYEKKKQLAPKFYVLPRDEIHLHSLQHGLQLSANGFKVRSDIVILLPTIGHAMFNVVFTIQHFQSRSCSNSRMQNSAKNV